MMHMTFWWGSNIGDIFIKGVTVNSTGSLVLLCTILISLSILFEGLKVHNAKTKAKAARLQRSASAATSENTTLISIDSTENRQSWMRKAIRFAQEAAVYLIHNALGYALMLTVMIYNGYLFVAVVVGMTVGYFCFGHISMRVNMENVQARKTTVICTKGVESGNNAADGSSNSEAQNYDSIAAGGFNRNEASTSSATFHP